MGDTVIDDNVRSVIQKLDKQFGDRSVFMMNDDS